MTNEGLKQKLTAILSADVKDYSRLMSQDRVGTIDTLKSHRDLFSDFIQKYGGRVIDNPGDEILSAFESVSDIVNCSVEIQREFAERNAEVPSARMMQWRIGISLGEVIEEDGRIYGDGVNIAARIQSLTEPGSICISGTVHDHVKDRLGLEYEDLGEQEVKNIPDLVRIYRVLFYPGAAAHRVTKAKADLKKTWRNAAFTIAAVIIVGIGSLVVWNSISQKEISSPEVAVREQAVVPTEKPSIAVLPFENMSGDPEQEYFSDGMAEEIINGLAKNPGLIVKGRTSSFSDMVRNKDIKTIAELLSVTHVVEGSVRKSGDRIRITAQLIDTAKDAHLWSDKYDRELTDVFKIQDEISGKILKALNIHLLGSDEKQIRTSNMKAYNAYLLGCYHEDRMQLDEAIQSFEKAIRFDPDYADAYAQLARTYSLYLWWSASRPVKEDWHAVHSYIEKALSLKPNLAEALALKVIVSAYEEFAYQESIYELDRLVQKHPNNIYVLTLYADILEAIGRLNLAVQVYDRMLEIEPLSPELISDRGTVFFHMGQFEEARKAYAAADDLGASGTAAVHLSMVACEIGDIKALRKQLNRDLSEWSGGAEQWHFFFKAAAPYFEGNQKRSTEILDSYVQSKDFIPAMKKNYISLLKGKKVLALDYFSQALSECSPVAFREIHKPFFYHILFPEYRSHPKYQKMLRDVGLDEESIAKLKIPPWPF